jgi:O-acetyl-ADP-ribose deacetylase (regulator of RNase III)
MMISIAEGDILRTDAEALVNTVNCVGYMGRGIALQFKRAFPDNFKAYESACRRHEVQPGSMFVFSTGQLTNPRYVINFPTKRHWRGASRLADIHAGLVALAKEVERLRIKTIAIPPLGCGLGGLRWEDVRPLIERTFGDSPNVEVLLFEPSGRPDTTAMTKGKEVPNLTPGRAVLIGLIERYLAGLMDPSVSLLEVHKLMYFAQEAGEKLRLRFVKALYGPYADNLRHVLSSIEGHFISGYADGGDDPSKQLELIPGAVEDANRILATHADTKARFARVADLVEGFETPFGMELLATVHWVGTREGAQDPVAATKGIYAWNERKRRFSPEQIRVAWEALSSKSWLPTTEAEQHH